MNKTKMPDLAEDLILEIQLRLPVKSVIRFKSVSKSWFARFQNPAFIGSHFAKQKYLDGDNFDRSVVLPFGLCLSYDPSFKFLTKMEECNSTLTAKENIRFPVLSKNASWCIKTQCMGIILLSHGDGEKLALWNPTTREFKLLPRLSRSKSNCLLLAFGYDHKTSDFKLVRYVEKNKGGKTLGTTEMVGIMEIYSLNHNKWRELPIERKHNFGTPSSIYINGVSTFINGVSHWVEYANSFSKTLLMSFDMTNETIKTTNVGVDYYSNFELFSVGESLTAVQTSNVRGSFINLWKFSNLDDPASWTKQKLDTGYYCLGFWKNSQIFSMRFRDNDLLLHDLNTGKNKILKEKFCPSKAKQYGRSWETLGCLVYVESLYQIKGKNDEKE